MMAHVVGMWATVALVAPLVAVTIGVLRRALDQAGRAVQQAAQERQRSEHLAALGTLDAGAAHELSTPLSTIALAVGELSRRLVDRPDCDEDLALTEEQIARCRAILARLAADVGTGMGELRTPQPIGDLFFFTTKAAGEGTGLGLFVAASVAQQLGGGLALTSPPGGGTTVALYLPWSETQP